MIDNILRWSIIQRWLVVIGAVIVTVVGVYNLTQMPLDVFPNFAPPQVEIQTEAPGLAPEEVESLISLPIESAVNGTPGVETVRSSSGVGISVVKIIFNWGTNIYQARQLVTERLQQAAQKLPENIEAPQISPISSPIGTVLSYAFTIEAEQSETVENSQNQTDMMEVRQFVDLVVTNRLLAVPGVSQLITYGGDIRQYQVLVDPDLLTAFNVSLEQVTQAARKANNNAAGGFLINPDRELLIRGLGRITAIEDLQKSVVTARDGTPVLLSDVAEVQIGTALKRGDGSLNTQPAVVVMVNKQPQADTPTVSKAVEIAMEELKPSLPKNVKYTVTFRQQNFIDAAIENVTSSLRDGAIIVSIILLMFLMNWRTTIITLSAIPLSVLIGMMVLNFFGLGINTMTLGGLVVAIGSVVDDSIVDMENAYRGLRENQQAKNPVHPFQVVFDTSVQVRTSVIFSTVIIVVVFAPIFSLSGVEGRIFAPMGWAYLVSILSSTLVAMTLSPALCAILLANQKLPDDETWVTRLAKKLYYPLLNFSLKFPSIVILTAFASFIASMIIFTSLGRVFLPEFQESTLVNSMLLYPSTSLEVTNQAGKTIESALKDDPSIASVQMRSGRAPGDADAAPVNLAHLDIEISEEGMKNREATVEKVREEFTKIPGSVASIGGFISHRMDEILSGVRSAIAVKIYGPELEELRRLGAQVETVMKDIPGLVDLQLEPQIPIKQVQIKFDRDTAARYGLSVGDLSAVTETALNGRVVSQVLEKQQLFDLLVWLKPEARNNLETIGNLLVDTPNGQKIPLATVAKIDYGTGPNTINRENVSRLIIVSSNVSGRDLGSAVDEIRAKVKEQVQVPSGYFIQYGGQFESEQRASRNFLIFGSLSFSIIAILMYFAVKSVPATLMIMSNLPLAMIGGVLSVAWGGGIISVASMVGFITLFGVATRNGLLLVENYNSKFAMKMPLSEVIWQGSTERLVAILMTALTSALGMVPLVIGTGAGKEILQPLAIVVLGGLFTSTALTLLVLPALYSKFGRYLIPKNNLSVIKMEITSEKTVDQNSNFLDSNKNQNQQKIGTFKND